MHKADGRGLSLQTAISKEELEVDQKKRELLEKSKEELKQQVKSIAEQGNVDKTELLKVQMVQDTRGRKRLELELGRMEKQVDRRSRSRSQSPTTKALIRAQTTSDLPNK